jgi:hypothetical protein
MKEIVGFCEFLLFDIGYLLIYMLPELNQDLAQRSPYPLFNALSVTVVSILVELFLALNSSPPFLWRLSDIQSDLVSWIPFLALFSGMSTILVQYCYSEVYLNLVIAFSFFPFLLMTIFLHVQFSFSFSFFKILSLVVIVLGLLVLSNSDFQIPRYLWTRSEVVLLFLTGVCGFISTMIDTLWKLKFQSGKLTSFRSLMVWVRVIASILLFIAFYLFELPIVRSPISQLVRPVNVLEIVSIVFIVELTSVIYSYLRNSPHIAYIDEVLTLGFLPEFLIACSHCLSLNFEPPPIFANHWIIGLVLLLGGYYLYSFGDFFIPSLFSQYFCGDSSKTATCDVINGDFLTVALPPIGELPFVSTFAFITERSDGFSNWGRDVCWAELKSRSEQIEEKPFYDENKIPLL